MLGRLYESQACSAARALEIVGERWSLLILRDALFGGFTRFSDFQRSLGIAPNILATRLESFVKDGIMEVRPSAPNSGYQQYVLTPKGLDLKPVVIALTAWGDKWVAPGPAEFEHADCGGIVEQHLRCTHCDTVPVTTEVLARRRSGKAERSPSGKQSRRMKRKTTERSPR